MDIKIERILKMTLDTEMEVQYFKGMLELARRQCIDWKENAQDINFKLSVNEDPYSFESMMTFIKGLDMRFK